MAVSPHAPAPVMVIVIIYRIPTKGKFCKQRTNGRNPETMTCTSCLCAQQPFTFHSISTIVPFCMGHSN